jgi:hippurate hydrolase
MYSSQDLSNLDTEMRTWRKTLHKQPELGFHEHLTAEFITAKLRDFGIEEIATGVGMTGIVATLRNGNSNKSIAFRADMDALPIQEAGEKENKSKNPDIMHACGHDGHVTMLLGAAKVLSQSPNFDGIIRLIFQPSEENGKGMVAMLDDGLLRDFPFEEIYGLHNRPGLPIGQFATRSGAFMAAEDNFAITLQGRGGHSGKPHDQNDALIAGCATVMNLQTIVSRKIDPSQLSILSATEISTDGLRNAIAGRAEIRGDVRTYDQGVSKKIETELRRIVNSTALMFECEATIDYTREFIPLINDNDATKHALKAAKSVCEKDGYVDSNANQLGSSEDFAQILEKVPGNFMNLGNGDSASLHNPNFDFDDNALLFGVRYYVQLASSRLSTDRLRNEIELRVRKLIEGHFRF